MKRKKNLAKAVGAAMGAAAVSAMLAGCDLFPPAIAVYGPPPEREEFNEEENIPETVYGPPEWFEPEENMNEDVYGPPPFEEDYDAEENLPAPVYGPPPGEEGAPVQP